MPKVNIFITNINGERIWNVDRPLPTQVQIAVNVNIVGFEKLSDILIEMPFIFTVNYNPAIAQITIKGKGKVSGEKEELSKILKEHRENRQPPTPVIQAVSNAAIAEAILISKSIGVPSPLPPINIPLKQKSQKQPPRYTT